MPLHPGSQARIRGHGVHPVTRGPRRAPAPPAAARARSRRTAAPAATGIPTTAVHTAVAGPTCHHSGPKWVRARTPSGPPASPASTPSARPHHPAAIETTATVRPSGQASSRPGVPRAAPALTANHATVTPAASGTSTLSQGDGAADPSCGKAASRGNAGSGSAGVCVPETCGGQRTGDMTRTQDDTGPEPVSRPPHGRVGHQDQTQQQHGEPARPPPVSCTNEARAVSPCHTSDAATSRAPPPTRTPTPATAARAAPPSTRSSASTRRRTAETGRPPVRGSILSARLPRNGLGPHGLPYAVQTPAPAAITARRGRQITAQAQEGRSVPPEAYSTAAQPTDR